MSEQDPDLASLVDLYAFGGHTFKEIAAQRGIGETTVRDRYRRAERRLFELLEEPTAPE